MRGYFRCEPLTAPLFNFSREGANGLGRGKRTSFTARERRMSSLDGRQKFNALPLALFPQGQGFLNRFFFAMESPALNGVADEGLLVGGEVYFHWFKATENASPGQYPHQHLCHFQPLELKLFSGNVGEIVMRLLDEPGFGASSEDF